MEAWRRSDYDNLPIKNKLPDKVRNRFWTKKQWLELGKKPKENAACMLMHPNSMAKKLIAYYFEEDVENFDRKQKICVNCAYRNPTTYYCIVAGSHVSPDHKCSEWEQAEEYAENV